MIHIKTMAAIAHLLLIGATGAYAAPASFKRVLCVESLRTGIHSHSITVSQHKNALRITTQSYFGAPRVVEFSETSNARSEVVDHLEKLAKALPSIAGEDVRKNVSNGTLVTLYSGAKPTFYKCDTIDCDPQLRQLEFFLRDIYRK